MSIFSIAGAQYDVDDVKIAKRLGNGVYGALVDIPSVNMYMGEIQIRSATGRGDGGITALASSIESANVTFRNISFSQAASEIFLGFSSYLSGTSPTRTRSMKMGIGKAMPYFGIVGRSLSSDSDACTMMFFPYVKIMQPFSVSFNDNEFVSPEIQCMAVGDPYLTDDTSRPLLVQIKEYETAVPIGIPLP